MLKKHNIEIPRKIRLVIEEAYNKKIIDKNIWSKTCSCMDWLDVSINTLKIPEFSREVHDENSIKLLTFIIQVDLLIDSVEQLWLSAKNGIGIEDFKFDSREVFSGNEFGREYLDREYFKMIRAWFGIHAVNGKPIKLTGYQEDNIRFYSSWSLVESIEKCLINLYSNNAAAEEEYGGIKTVNLNKILEFAKYFYLSLEILINRIEEKLNKIDPLRENIDLDSITSDNFIKVNAVIYD